MLPDATKLHALSPETWRALGLRLVAIGLLGEPGAQVVRLAERRGYARHAPSAKWHARRSDEPWAAAARMLVLRDPVSEAEARAALGDVPLEGLLDAGLLERTGGGVVSRYTMQVVWGLLILCDDLGEGGDSAMGWSKAAAATVRVAMPRERVKAALDLGCGAGTMALALAARCDRVVATDISARAVEVARVNGWLNGISNVDFRQGDLFEPVAGEAFDIVVSQPPFVAQPEGEATSVYLFGGARGDELVLRLVRDLPRHLAPGGLAVLRVDWPVGDEDAPVDERIRAAMDAPDASVLVMETQDRDLDEYCESYARVSHHEQDAAWEALALARRDHVERMKLRSIRETLSIVRRSPDGAAGWTSLMQSNGILETRFSRARLDALMSVRDLVLRGPSELRRARMRIPPGATFESGPGLCFVEFARRSIHVPTAVPDATLRIARLVDAASTAGEAVDGLAKEAEAPEAVADGAFGAIASALLCGLLEIA